MSKGIHMDPESKLNQKIAGDLKEAMRSGDTLKRSVLRMLMSSIHNAEIAKQGALSEADILGIISKEVKQRQESIDSFKQANRQDLIDGEAAEKAILQDYLPEQMSRDEIIAAAKQVISEVGAESPRDKGKVMQQLVPKLKGRADGQQINAVVTELLQQ